MDKPIFQPFHWHGDMPPDGHAYFVETVKDVADGIGATLELIAADEMTEDFGEQRLLGDNCKGKLMRLALASAGMLARLADIDIQHRCEQREKQKKPKRSGNADPS